jgi:purine-binding chemotaxis protein CheW
MNQIGKTWVLRLGNLLLGVAPKALKEVLEVTQLTPVPLAPPSLLGLLSNQGRVVPVFDLSPLLQLPPIGSGLAALLEAQGQPIAFMIDEVVGLRSDLYNAVSPGQAPLFSAVVKDGEQTIHLLNPSGLLEHLTTQFSAAARAAAMPIQAGL